MNGHLLNKRRKLLSCLHSLTLSGNNKEKLQDSAARLAVYASAVSCRTLTLIHVLLIVIDPNPLKSTRGSFWHTRRARAFMRAARDTPEGNCGHLGKHHLASHPFLLLTLLLHFVCACVCDLLTFACSLIPNCISLSALPKPQTIRLQFCIFMGFSGSRLGEPGSRCRPQPSQPMPGLGPKLWMKLHLIAVSYMKQAAPRVYVIIIAVM